MLVTVVSKPGIFRDLLASAVVDAGHTLKALTDRVPPAETFSTGECLVVYAQTIEITVCKNLLDLGKLKPELPVAIVCLRGLEDALAAEIGMNVNVVLPDDQPLELVMGALTVVSQGYTLFDSAQLEGLREGGTMPPPPQSQPCLSSQRAILSKRENTVLAGIRSGLSNKEIARELQISDSTVKVHMRSIFRKIGVHNRTQAAIWATDNE